MYASNKAPVPLWFRMISSLTVDERIYCDPAPLMLITMSALPLISIPPLMSIKPLMVRLYPLKFNTPPADTVKLLTVVFAGSAGTFAELAMVTLDVAMGTFAGDQLAGSFQLLLALPVQVCAKTMLANRHAARLSSRDFDNIQKNFT